MTTPNIELVATLWHSTPSKSTDYGEEGWIAYDHDFFYLYTNNRWVRRAMSEFSEF
jgi:hypothetical protein